MDKNFEPKDGEQIQTLPRGVSAPGASPGSQRETCMPRRCLPRVLQRPARMHETLRTPLPSRLAVPRRTANRGRFACDETLKRHLLFPSYASCKDAVLRLLGLDSIPASGCGTGVWIVPLRDSPERPWERPGFHLTDLETVKELLCQREHLHARLHVVVIPAPTPQRNRTCTFSRSKWTKMRRQSRS